MSRARLTLRPKPDRIRNEIRDDKFRVLRTKRYPAMSGIGGI